MMHMKEKHFVWHRIQFSSDLRGEQTCFPSAPGTLHNHHTTPPPSPSPVIGGLVCSLDTVTP